MSKNIITPIIIVLLVLGGIAVFSILNSNNTEDAKDDLTVSDLTREHDTQDQQLNTMPESEESTMNDHYVVQSATASYIVYKDFLLKEDIEVIGTTDDLSVDISELEDGKVEIMADVNLLSLTTDSAQRDSDVQKYWTNPLATLKVELDPALFQEGTINKVVTAEVTINDVTQELEFQITGSLNETLYSVEGVATANISDFGLTPPNLAEVYVVQDEFQLMFEVEIAENPVKDDENTEAAPMESDAMEEDKMENETMDSDSIEMESEDVVQN